MVKYSQRAFNIQVWDYRKLSMVKGIGGYLGRVLRVDLGREKITVEPLDNSILRKFIGGAGLGAKCLYDEVPPGVEWSDPENPFTGSRVSPIAQTRKRVNP